MLWLRRLNTAALLLCFLVVVFGSYVRLSNAGLGCPDWPGCYGHLTVTDVAADAPKAWKEMIHRYLAMTLGLLIAVQAIASLVARRERVLCCALLPLVGLQAWMGRLTVTWQLKPLAVTGHLLGGMTTLALLLWLWLYLRDARVEGAPQKLRGLAVGALALLALQIFLGGWTSSNYAATACPELPTCQGRWLPPPQFGEAFTLWRGLDRSYEGGVLETPARQTIHMTHRYGAAAVTVMTLWLGLTAFAAGGAWRGLGLMALTALAAQVAIGLGLIKLHFPLLMAAAHNAGAALLLAALVTLNFFAWNPDRSG